MSEALEKLTRARDALLAKERAAALEALLGAWRACPAKPIGDLVHGMGAEIDRSLPPISGKSQKQAFEQWMTTCDRKQAVDVGRLLEWVVDGTAAMIQARATELAKRPPDPRVSRRLAAYVLEGEAVGTSGSARGGWRWMFTALRAARDPAVVPVLEAALAKIRNTNWLKAWPSLQQFFRESLEKVLSETGTEPTLDAAAIPLLEEIHAQIEALARAPALVLEERPPAEATSMGLSDEALYAMIAESPADDGPRQVLSDSWLARGDERGEFVAIQLRVAARGKATAPEKKRMNELLRKHARTLAGELANVIEMKTAVFERGRLAVCTTAFARAAQRTQLKSSPLWATVREIHTAETCLFEAGSLRALETIHCALPLLERIWSSSASPIASVSLLAGQAPLRASPIFSAAPGFPLRSLSIRLDAPLTPLDCAALLAPPWVARLETLAIHSTYEPPLSSWIDSIRAAGALPKQGLDLVHLSDRLEHIRMGSRGVRFELRAGKYSHHALMRILGAVAPALVEAIHVVEASPALRAWIEERFPVAS